jgi:hypothetical protein
MSVRSDRRVCLRMESQRMIPSIMLTVSPPVKRFTFGTVTSQSGFW